MEKSRDESDGWCDLNTTTAYAIRWQGLWWSGKKSTLGNVDKFGSPLITDATFFTDDEMAADIAKELGGHVKRVDLVRE